MFQQPIWDQNSPLAPHSRAFGIRTTSPGSLPGSLFSSLGGPVKDVVIPESFTYKEITEDLSEIRVVRLLIETKRPAVVEINGELIRESATKVLGRYRHLLVHDTITFLFLSSTL